MASPQSQPTLDRKHRFVFNFFSKSSSFYLHLLRVLSALCCLNLCPSFLDLTIHSTCLQTAHKCPLSIQMDSCHSTALGHVSGIVWRVGCLLLIDLFLLLFCKLGNQFTLYIFSLQTSCGRYITFSYFNKLCM